MMRGEARGKLMLRRPWLRENGHEAQRGTGDDVYTVWGPGGEILPGDGKLQDISIEEISNVVYA